jgi:hypothetical protein
MALLAVIGGIVVLPEKNGGGSGNASIMRLIAEDYFHYDIIVQLKLLPTSSLLPLVHRGYSLKRQYSNNLCFHSSSSGGHIGLLQ